MSGLWSRVIWPIAIAVAVAEFTALLASNAGPTGFVVALLVSLGTKTGGLMTNWNSVDGLISVFVGYVFSTVLGLLRYGMFRLIADFFRVVMDIGSIAEIGLGNLYRIVTFPISIAFGGRALTRLHELGAVA